jgi:hypothetical protein
MPMANRPGCHGYGWHDDGNAEGIDGGECDHSSQLNRIIYSCDPDAEAYCPNGQCCRQHRNSYPGERSRKPARVPWLGTAAGYRHPVVACGRAFLSFRRSPSPRPDAAIRVSPRLAAHALCQIGRCASRVGGRGRRLSQGGYGYGDNDLPQARQDQGLPRPRRDGIESATAALRLPQPGAVPTVEGERCSSSDT